ncbi:MAG: hypothetical protein JKY48_00830 [Flavobacteriales bacterium]|nr:hypothetical protein [Flavobacteriales bacterium]
MGLRLFSLIIVLLVSFGITSCGGGGGGGGASNSNETPQAATVTVLGSGVKGILANTTVSIYELDITRSLSYDPARPVATGVTDSVGRSAALEIPTNITNPLVLVVDGTSGIDLNSSRAPVITNLTSIFTIEDALAGNPIFATPYTTIAHEMAKLNSTSGASNVAFQSNFASAITDVGTALGFGTSTNVNFLTTPAVLSASMNSQAQQQAILQHRAAIEALAAIILELKNVSGNTLSTADVVIKLADDLFNDGIIDGDSGLDLSAIPANVENLYVPGTQIKIKDIGETLEADRQYTGVITNSVASLSPRLSAPVISLNDGGSTNINTGTPKPAISFSASNINFGNVTLGEASDPILLTLTNIGSAPLTISSITPSDGFIQANSCNGFVPSAGSCTLEIVFVPVVPGNASGLLSVSGDMVGTRTVSLVGASDAGASSGTPVLQVNFENLARGSYRESDLRSDFRVGTQGYRDSVSGPDNDAVDIVADPANSGRGNVMRVVHHAGVGGGSTRREGGMRWRADLPPADEYYLAYDIYVANDWHEPHQLKLPGLINGTQLEASHSFGVIPAPETLTAFTALMQINRHDAFGRGNAAMGGHFYDKDRVQRHDWLSTIDPTSEAVVGQYNMPQGRWVKIGQYMKSNTVNQRDGKLMIWIDGVLMSDQLHRWRADLSYPGNRVSNANRRIDGIWLLSYYGGNPSDPRNREHGTQHQYYDNFIVSDSPITH